MITRRKFTFTALTAVQATAADVWDVCVYGGVPCGIASALAAAREGAKVLLIEPTKHVGGLSTSGINTAESEHMLLWTIGGIALDFYKRLGGHYGTGKPEFFFESSVAEKVYLAMLREAGVTIRYGARVDRVDKAASHIRGIRLTDGSVIQAKVFVDAGYEGDLMARAGVPAVSGRESRDEFGEEAAGVRFDKVVTKAATVDSSGRLLPGISAWARDLKEGSAHRGVMNYNFRLTFARDEALRRPFPKPQKYDPVRYSLLRNWLLSKQASGQPVKLAGILDFYPRRNGKFEVNNKQAAIISLGHFGGQFDYPEASYARREQIVADHWDYTLGLIHFLASDQAVPASLQAEMHSWGLHRQEFADNGNLPYQLYVREARRMRGASIVLQKDCIDERRKDDAIGISSHFIDSHHVQRVALSEQEFVNEGRIWRTSMAYQIPYRALTPNPEHCTNLVVPGAASFSHVAFCSYRLESVWMIAGHAAGVAAAFAAKANQSIQRIDVKSLQQKLRAQGQVVDFVPGQPERWTDVHNNTGGPPVV
ncbi:MAG: FAD-dependent oxidoreductase [Bryobacterales bacterium]|nr:FAD-dependent oxidoreductase [Bryobacterales bacterium]